MLNQFKQRVGERWENLYETERRRLRLIMIFLLVVLIGWLGFRLLREPIRQWRGQHALEQAEDFLQQRDYRNALVALKRATMLTPSDPSTWRVVAKHLDELGLPEALVAHENILQLDPQDTTQRLVLARRALEYDNEELAAKTLMQVPAEAAEGEEYHRLAAAIALSTGRQQDYLEHLRAIQKLRPDDPGVRFNLAVVDLWSGDAEKEELARAEFVTLLSVPEVRIRAALELLKDASRHWDAATATEVAIAIDKALPLPIYLEKLAPGWGRLRGKLKAAASTPEDVALLARWLGSLGLARETLEWINQQPTGIQNTNAVRAVAVTLSVIGDDSQEFVRWVSTGVWGQLPEPLVNLMAQVVKARGMVKPDAASVRTAWLNAFAGTHDSSLGLRALARLAILCRNVEETERALRALIRLLPHDGWANESLATLLREQKQAVKLWELYRDWYRADSVSPQVAAQWWILSSVLDRLTPEAGPKVEKWVEDYPDHALVNTAAAAVWWRQGDSERAFEFLAELPEDEKRRPEIAFWLAVIGSEVADNQWESSFEIAADHQWLPEEASILSNAGQNIRSGQ